MFDSPIDEIKSRLSITEVLQDYIQLKKAGTNFKAVCPFHSEKSASFMVSPSKQIWHCFGCGLGGDIFEFIKQIENVEFVEALRILASRAGVELKKPTVEQIQANDKKDVLYEINEQAAKYFAKVLWESNAGSEALAYLHQRGLTDQTIKNWQLGFAPDDFHYLENFLAKNFNKKDIEQAGLIIKKEDLPAGRQAAPQYFDRFHDRVMFPIVSLHGQVVGFTGRLLHDKPNTGKYVNSPETPIYNKSQVIYGLYQGKNQIRKENRAVVVEGNLDVITSHQAGFTQTVASSGTAFTEKQLLELHKLTETLVFAFDSDKAGVLAAERTLSIALTLGFNVKIIKIQDAKDPDELIKRGIGIWRKHIDNAPHYIDFILEEALQDNNPNTPEGIEIIKNKLIPLINYLNSKAIRDHFVLKLAKTLGIRERTIFEELSEKGKPKIKEIATDLPKNKSRKERLEEEFLGLVLITRQKEFLSDLDKEEFSPQNREIFEILQTEDIAGKILYTKHPDLKQQFDLLEFVATEEPDGISQNPKIKFKDIAKNFMEIIYKERLDKYQREYAGANENRKLELGNKINETAAKKAKLAEFINT